MTDEFTHRILRMVIGRVCQPLGVHGMQQSVCDCMADVLKQYILTLGRTTASYCAHANRTEPNLADVFEAFRDLGINLSDLAEFTREVESVPPPEPIPRYPIPRSSTHIYHAPSGGKPAAASRRARTGSLSSEDESDRDHIPPYLPPLPLEADEEKDDVDEENADQAEKSRSSTPMDTSSQPPPDPTKGLPQLFRSRRLSSDFSEDGGESASSRRNSISNGATLAARTPGNGTGTGTGVPVTLALTSTAAAESVANDGNNSRGTGVVAAAAGVGEKKKALLTEGGKVLSASVVVQKLNVFDAAFSKKLESEGHHKKPVEHTQSAQLIDQTEGTKDPTSATTDEAPPTMTKPELPLAQSSQSAVVFQKPQPPSQTRVLPPPLKLMSPTSGEHPANPNLPTQQPPLSPLTTRSPVQLFAGGMPRMPVLSPLRTPTSASRHPIRMSGSFTHPTAAGSPLLSPPALRSPVDTVPTPIDAHLHAAGAMPLSTAPPHVHGPPPQIPYSAHPPPPSQPPPLVQAQATPTPAEIMPTSAVSSEAATVKSEEALATTQPEMEQTTPDTDDANLQDAQKVAIVSRKRAHSETSDLSISPSPPPTPTPVAEKSDTEIVPKSPTSPEKDSTLVEEQPSPSPRSATTEDEEGEKEREIPIDTLHISEAERLSASPVSAEESIITPQGSPVPQKMTAAPAMIEETSLKDLEISDDGLSDDEDEEEEEAGERRGSEEAPLITIKPSSPRQPEEEIEQEESRLSATPSPSVGGKKMMKELSFSPVSSPGSEFETEPRIESVEREEVRSPAAQDVAQVSVQPTETDLEEIEAEKDFITSPETFLDVSSDDERAEETIDQPPIAASQASDSELVERQEDEGIERKPGDTKVAVLESARLPYGDDNVQDMGTVEEVLEVLEQKLSSDEESEESDEEEEEEGEEIIPEGAELGRGGEVAVEEHKLMEEVEPESVGVASEIGGDDIVSGEGVMVGGEEDEEDMVETLSAMVHSEPQPQQQQQQPTCTLTTVTTKAASRPGKTTSREDVLGIKKSAPAPPRPKSLKISFRRHLIPSLRPTEPKKSQQHQQKATPMTTPTPSPAPPTTTTTSRFLTKAEKKADLASHMYHQQHHGHGAMVAGGSSGVLTTSGAVGGSNIAGGGGGLIVTPGETKNLSVLLSSAPSLPPPASSLAPHTPSASPSPSPAPPEEEEELLDQPLTITINRRLLRQSRFGIPTPVEERSRLPTANALKMRLARFGAVVGGQASPTGSVTTVTSHVTSVPPVVNPRKRERDPDHQGTKLVVGREVKRSRHESPPVQVPSHHRQVSSSSSSSSTSSEDDDSGSDESIGRSSSPYPSGYPHQPIVPPPPAPLSASTPLPTPTLSSHHPHHHHHHRHHQPHYHQLHRHRTRTPSSVEEEEEDEDDEEESVRAVTPASSESGSTLGGGGLKLTISKAVLKQAASQQKSVPPPSSSPLSSTTLFVGPAPTLEVEPSVSGRGSRRGSRGGSRRGRGGKRGRRSSASSSKAAAGASAPPPPPPTLSVKSSQPKKVKKKELAGGTAKPPPSSAKQPVPKIQVQSSSPITIKLPAPPSSSKSSRSSSKSSTHGSSSSSSSAHRHAHHHHTSRGRAAGITVSSLSVPVASTGVTGGLGGTQGSDYHCPECGLRDDGSPMIGCDGCDSWVHWSCAGITREPPENENWFCTSCIEERQAGKKKKGRKRKRTSN